MKRFSVRFSDRAFGTVPVQPLLRFQVQRYSKSDIGGCKSATIGVSGPEGALWALAGWLRYGIEIRDEFDTPTWWGLLTGVTITAGHTKVSFSIDEMVNRVRVSYTKRTADGSAERAITTEANDATSQAYYGAIKERIVRGGEMSDTSAATLRDDTLRALRNFGGGLEVGGDGAASTMVLECRGWWHTLSWRQLLQLSGDQSHYKSTQYAPRGFGVTYFPFGYTNGAFADDDLKLGSDDVTRGVFGTGQSFVLPTTSVAAVRVKDVAFYISTAGSPSFNVTLKIHADSSGAPGTLLYSSAPIAASAMSANVGWQAFSPASGAAPCWLMPGQRYWAVAERDGAGTSTSNYVSVWLVNPSSGPAAEAALEKIGSGSGYTVPRRGAGDFNLQVNVEHNEPSFEVGATSTRQQIAQSFQIGGTRPAAISQVRLRALRAQSPGDNLIVEICSDSAGVPGTVLASATVAGSTLASDYADFDVTIPTASLLTPGTTYHLKLRRSGAVSNAAFYVFAASEAKLYTTGSTLIYNGSAWVAATPDAELLFELSTAQETSSQVAYAVTDVGALLAGSDLQLASGVYESGARDGETTAGYEIEKWLKAGTTNNRRMLAEVETNRRVRVSEAPADSAGPALYIGRDGCLRTWARERVDHLCPVGIWLAPRDIAPATAGFAPVDGATLFYIEECEYDAVSDRSQPRIRGQRDPFDLGGIDA